MISRTTHQPLKNRRFHNQREICLLDSALWDSGARKNFYVYVDLSMKLIQRWEGEFIKVLSWIQTITLRFRCLSTCLCWGRNSKRLFEEGSGSLKPLFCLPKWQFFLTRFTFFFTEYPGRFFNVETNERIYLCEFNQSCYILYQTYSRIASFDFWLFLVWYQYHSVLFLLEVYVPNRFSLLSFLSFSPAETRVHIKHNL